MSSIEKFLHTIIESIYSMLWFFEERSGGYTFGELEELRKRWNVNENKLKELISIIKNDVNWYESEAYQHMAKTLGLALDSLPNTIRFTPFDFRGAPLRRIDLSGAKLTLLQGPSAVEWWGVLRPGGYMQPPSFKRIGVDFSGADLREANLSDTDFTGANLSQANLWGADLSRANLVRADLSGAVLWGANLSEANLAGVSYTTDEVFNRLIKWWIPKCLNCIPVLKDLKWGSMDITQFDGVDTTKVDGSKNPVLKRHMEDYQFIRTFKYKSWVHRWLFYPLWKVTSDCGRSLLLWLILSAGFVALFTIIYSRHLDWFIKIGQPNLNWFNALYFSITTFTTLGFGDITPRLENIAAQAWVMGEVVIGYIMLGGLISILANKLARRA